MSSAPRRAPIFVVEFGVMPYGRTKNSAASIMTLLAAGAVSKMGGEVSLATARRAPEKGVTVSGAVAKNELTAAQRQAHFFAHRLLPARKKIVVTDTQCLGNALKVGKFKPIISSLERLLS